MSGFSFMRLHRKIRMSLLFLAAFLGVSVSAFAVPSYTRQTGQECAACHVGSFGPQLTPYGIKFNVGGYTDSNGESSVPLSAMLVGNWTHTQKGQGGGAAPHFSDNNNSALQEASVFLAGKLADHLGSFSQVTYSGIDHKVHLDNIDIRYARETDLGGLGNATLGISFNNNPTLQDPFNTLPAWRFPFTSSDLAPPPSAAPMLDGGLEQTVGGASVYALSDTGLYGELGVYSSFGRGFLESANVIDPADPGAHLVSTSPYWRLAYFRDLKTQAYSVGLVGMSGRMHDYGVGGPSNRYSDVGIDASYQYLGNRKHIFSVYGSYIHEHQTLSGAYANGDVAKRNQNLDQLKINGSYYYDKTYGVTLGYFDTRGSRDYVQWASGKPDSSGWIMQADWTPFGKESSWGAPWANLRLGLQYTAYNKFDGASHNYDGNGRDARDNNTLMGFVWTSF
jgi:hypothetical protein